MRTLGLGLGLGGAPQFVPTKLAGCVLWLRADLGIILNGGNVSEWADQSGAGNNATQGLAGNRPAYNASDSAYAGCPTLSFSAASSLLISAFSYAQPYTVVCVGEADESSGSDGFCGSGGTSIAGVLYQAATTQVFQMYSGVTLAGTAIVNTKCAMMGIFNGASSSGYVNASQTPTASGSVGTNALANFGLGADAGAPNALTGKIAEISVYARALTASERHALFSYHGARYGIAVS